MSILYNFLGSILNYLYVFTKSYGLSITLFTIIVKLLMLPLIIKQQKSMEGMQKIQPQLTKIQQKYKNDKEKLNQETMKLYEQYNINPMGGCLPMLIQLPIIFALYRVINRPLTYIVGLASDKIIEIHNYLNLGIANIEKTFQNNEIIIANAMNPKVGELSQVLNTNLYEINFQFLKIFDLARKPWDAFTVLKDAGFSAALPFLPILLIPLASTALTYWQNKITLANTKQSENSKNNEAANTANSMNKIMPLMTLYFTMILPSGVGLYWVISSLIQIIQQILITKYLKKEDINQKA